MRVLIVGATSGIAKECARIWATRPDANLILVGRNQRGLESVAADLQVRNPKAQVSVHSLDLTNAAAVEALEGQLAQAGNIDVALIAHGELTDQAEAQASVAVLEKSVTVNATSVALFTELAARIMERQGFGKIAVIGSVAGDRGRKANYTYGAAKAFLHTYVRGLQHRFAGTKVVPVIIKPGPTATPMTTALAAGGKLASAQDVARQIVRGIDAGKKTIYAPGLWAIIMLVVRLIPAPIFNKLNF